jgi:hypothetical protein
MRVERVVPSNCNFQNPPRKHRSTLRDMETTLLLSALIPLVPRSEGRGTNKLSAADVIGSSRMTIATGPRSRDRSLRSQSSQESATRSIGMERWARAVRVTYTVPHRASKPEPIIRVTLNGTGDRCSSESRRDLDRPQRFTAEACQGLLPLVFRFRRQFAAGARRAADGRLW